ncbi:MAG: hypothetical protein ACE5H9_16615 [Anaerolineae bacterium]
MPTNAQIANLTLQVDAGQDTDAEELDRLTRQLRDELWELDVESVELAAGGDLPEGAKSAEALTLGALAVAVLPAVVPKLVEFLQAWSMRGENRVVKIKTQAGDRSLEVEYDPKTMTPTELKDLVDILNATLADRGGG